MSRAAAGLVFVVLLVSNAWFYQAGGWNQNSRFDLVRAVVERGTLRIDAYHQNTGDKARRGGHVYSDKAPGLALAAVPVAVVARPIVKAKTADEAGYARWLSYVLTVAVAGLPAAFTGLLVLLLARRLGASERGAVVAALAFGLATPAWAYGTLFFGHALATFGLFAAFAGALALEATGTPRRDVVLALAVGLAAGWATITEYPSAPPAFVIALLALAQVWPGGWGRRLRVAGGVAGGAVAAAAVLLIYNWAAFGAPLATGYAHVEGFAGMQEGFMGVTTPKGRVLWAILFGSYRGLFFHAPVLLVALLGFPVLLATAGTARRAGVVALIIVMYYALFNAAYHYWTGGWSYGPRHMAPALPFLALGLAALWTRGKPALRVVVGGLAAVSFALTLVAVSTTAQPPEQVARPIADLMLPAFLDGDLSLNHQSVLEPGAYANQLRGGKLAHDAFNLGEVMGLSGLGSLWPLVGLHALAGAILVWLTRGAGGGIAGVSARAVQGRHGSSPGRVR